MLCKGNIKTCIRNLAYSAHVQGHKRIIEVQVWHVLLRCGRGLGNFITSYTGPFLKFSQVKPYIRLSFNDTCSALTTLEAHVQVE